MILHNEIKQIGGFLFNRRIELLTTERLVDRVQGTLEGLVLLMPKTPDPLVSSIFRDWWS